MNAMELQIAEREKGYVQARLSDGRDNIVRSLGERLGTLAADGWPPDYEVYLVVVLGEQLSTTDPKFAAGDRIRKTVVVDEVRKTLHDWAKKGRLITAVHVL